MALYKCIIIIIIIIIRLIIINILSVIQQLRLRAKLGHYGLNRIHCARVTDSVIGLILLLIFEGRGNGISGEDRFGGTAVYVAVQTVKMVLVGFWGRGELIWSTARPPHPLTPGYVHAWPRGSLFI